MEYLKKIKTIQIKILEFLDNEEDGNENFDELINFFDIKDNQIDNQELKSILYLISKISANHHRGPFFFDKIKQIIIHFQKEIKQGFSNSEIFDIFKDNKRVILLLINEGIITFDSNISSKIKKFKEFFYPETNKLSQNQDQVELPENYEEKRLKGENDSYLCEIIRNDKIEDFIVYYNKKVISLSMTIEPSIYETNSFLENKNPKLIEYSAFYGSIQIFRFLFQNQVRLTKSLWLYAIHGKNPDIIHFLEENNIYPNDKTYMKCLKESIKCHHNDFAMYFINNYITDNVDVNSNYFENEIYYGFRYYNFQFIPLELNDKFFFYYAVEYDYIKLVDFCKNIEGFNINEVIIYMKYFHEIFQFFKKWSF